MFRINILPTQTIWKRERRRTSATKCKCTSTLAIKEDGQKDNKKHTGLGPLNVQWLITSATVFIRFIYDRDPKRKQHNKLIMMLMNLGKAEKLFELVNFNYRFEFLSA